MAKRPIARFGLLGLAGLPYVFLLFGNSVAMPTQKKTSFADVALIFKAHCNSCHTGKESAAGLDLSTPGGVQKGGMSGKLINSAKPNSSLLLERVLGHGGMPRMPMGFAPLTATQTDTLRSWIAAGGKIDVLEKTHWAYVPPKRPAVPTTKLQGWALTPIDNFILNRLEKGALKPTAQASKENLIRRLSLDLTGLPPTLQEIDAFLADKSPNAYEKVVDRLLASKHFGERQAMGWLDLARYADTNGYEKDTRRVAWKYRDWVIDAFNKNQPFDQFTIEQLAGDLLPNPQLDQLIATGFHRNTMLNTEGGVDQLEARYELINDRVATTSTVWMGQTLQCARCHDHKYDPITQKDYFRVYAIFSNTEYFPMGPKEVSEEKYLEKDIPAPSPEQVAEQTKLNRELATFKASLSEQTSKQEMSAWLAKAKAAKPWGGFKADVSATNDVTLTPQSDGTYTAVGQNNKSVYKFKFTSSGPINAFKLIAVPDAKLPVGGSGRASSGNFLLSRVSLKVNGKEMALVRPQADFIQQGYALNGLSDNAGDTGWAVHPAVNQRHWLVLRPETSIPDSAVVELELGHESNTWPDHTLGRFALAVTSETDEWLQTIPENVVAALAKATPNPADEKLLVEFYQQNSPQLAPIREKIQTAESDLRKVQQSIPYAMVMTEKKNTGPLQTPLHIRGEYLQTGEMVPAGIPSSFGKTDAKRVDRLALAKWLVAKDNPMTARVQVNRIWEQYFGTGLVETSENWGTPGTPPSHPELLDWLATEFVASGWDMKKMHKLIVMSATYRQSSVATKAMLNRDPGNRLLARGPRFRLDAELIRDNALAAAGMLNAEIGGPSVYPLQPDGVWNSPYSGESWMTSKGKELHRRGMYTFLKRTAPYPTFTNFDASSREVCTVRRGRTNTPLQALNLLNDPAFLEAAKGLAQRVSKAKPGDVKAEVGLAFRLCTARHAKPVEIERLAALYNTLKTRYEQSPTEAKKLAPTAEGAAMVMVANVILNLDETINKE